MDEIKRQLFKALNIKKGELKNRTIDYEKSYNSYIQKRQTDNGSTNGTALQNRKK